MPLQFLGGSAAMVALVAQGGVAEAWTSFHVKPVTQLGEPLSWAGVWGGRGERLFTIPPLTSLPQLPFLFLPSPAEHICPACPSQGCHSARGGSWEASAVELWHTRSRETFHCSLG